MTRLRSDFGNFAAIVEMTGGHTFAFYATMMVLQPGGVNLVVPQPQGVRLEKIQRQLGIEKMADHF